MCCTDQLRQVIVIAKETIKRQLYHPVEVDDIRKGVYCIRRRLYQPENRRVRYAGIVNVPGATHIWPLDFECPLRRRAGSVSLAKGGPERENPVKLNLKP
jgi:hypothetical protein